MLMPPMCGYQQKRSWYKSRGQQLKNINHHRTWQTTMNFRFIPCEVAKAKYRLIYHTPTTDTQTLGRGQLLTWCDGISRALTDVFVRNNFLPSYVFHIKFFLHLWVYTWPIFSLIKKLVHIQRENLRKKTWQRWLKVICAIRLNTPLCCCCCWTCCRRRRCCCNGLRLLADTL